MCIARQQKDLLGQMKAMEDRLVSVTKEKASIIVNLKRDLAESNREKAAKEEFLNQIQQEYQALAKGSRVITNQSKGRSVVDADYRRLILKTNWFLMQKKK